MAIRLVINDTYAIIKYENLVNDLTIIYLMIGLMYIL